MDPLTIMALAQGALGVGQMVKGAIQGADKQPMMEIPKSAQQALQIAKTQAGKTQLPGQSIMEDKLASQAAAASQRMIEMSGGGGNALGGIAQINQGLSDQMGNILMNQASYADRQKQGLIGQLGNMANWEQQQFQMNEMQPYLQKMESAKSLKGAGMQNLWGAAGSFVEGQATKKRWDDYLKLQNDQMAQSGNQFQQQLDLWKQQNAPMGIPQTQLPTIQQNDNGIDIPAFTPQPLGVSLREWFPKTQAMSNFDPKTGKFYPNF